MERCARIRLVAALVAVVTARVPVAALAGAAALDRIPEALPGAPPLGDDVRRALSRALADRGPGYVPRTRHRRDDGTPLYTNRLLLESSPYLLQHAHNPVDWRPWGEEAFAAARALGRPVLVSIGYSTCHWCHVMEEESFEDPGIAELLNAHFVSVKVDREMRPDVDAVYMSALEAMQGRGGWPLNVWLTPEGEPFYGGTYFPPEDRGPRPGLPTVLRAIRDRYAEQPDRLREAATAIAEAVRSELEGSSAEATRVPGVDVLENAARQVERAADPVWGGLGRAPKFPSQTPIRFLLRHHRRTGDAAALEVAVRTLEKMAAGGLRDHVGGGFHRYATDREWLVPHFEKMLYDNAQLAVAYLEAHQVTGREDFAGIARDVLRYVARGMTSPEGAFYSATDADSSTPTGDSEEGYYFTWTPAELDAALGPDRARLVKRHYGVTEAGNFEGRNILHVAAPLADVARELEMEPAAVGAALDEARERLLEVRAERPPPHRDEKILVAWNGLMIGAYARAGLALAEPGFILRGARAARFLLERVRGEDGRLRRVYVDGRARGPAFLSDYAFLVAALLDLYEADPDPHWLREALSLQATLDAHYADASGGGYFQTADDHEQLLAREKPSRDGALPSGNSVEALNLLRLASLTGNADYAARAALVFSVLADAVSRAPLGLSELLLALDYHHDTAKEVVLVRPASGGDLAAMLDPLRTIFVPNRVLAVVSHGGDQDAHAELVPLVARKRPRDGRVTAYVCENRVCDLPTSDPEVFAKQLAAVTGPEP